MNRFVNKDLQVFTASFLDMMWPWENPSWLILACRLVVKQQAGRRRLAFGVSTSQLSLHVSFMLSSFPHADGMTNSSVLETPEKPLTFTCIMDIPCSICLLSNFHRTGGDTGQMVYDVSPNNDQVKPWISLHALRRWALRTQLSMWLLVP